MSTPVDQRSDFWRPLVVRGVPLHVVIPAATAVIGVGLMLAGGVASFIGGWLLAVGFPLAVGAFVIDTRALAAPTIVWAAWLLVVALTGPGSAVPQTPLVVAIALAGLGTAAAWLGQRAVQPAVEDPHGHDRVRRRAAGLVDDLVAPTNDPDASPSLDPSAEVDEALAELLAEPIEPPESEPFVESGDVSEAQSPRAQVERETSPEDTDEETGHVIEFAALREEDLDEAGDADPADSASDRS